MIRKLKKLIPAALLLMASAESFSEPDVHWREEFAYMTGKQAYIYAYPVMNNARMRYSWLEGEAKDTPFGGKANVYTHYRQLVDPSFQYGTSMNRDTLYSIALCYLGDGPMVFTFPENPEGRYISVQFIEWYTDAIGYMSRRNVGKKGGNGDVPLAG